jgi:hypothetical protein
VVIRFNLGRSDGMAWERTVRRLRFKSQCCLLG